HSPSLSLFSRHLALPDLHSFPTRRSSDLYSIVIGSKHITLNATGGGFLTASKQFRHGATSKSRSNTASNSTKHKLFGGAMSKLLDRKSGSAGMPRPISYAVFCLKKKNKTL